ncbi:S-methyl-5-thioribose-1-phosphate isomerase [Lunasporangiospora selenospora]|uniref:S-methyl-5-thioribose-1-phosphate isomerase n=1 Tax=Lunasporangiospora selenospora TaxID=979761 RepID=A0A9P6KGA7_9FUNG|nr:S-methyl-5-thioribose-1-phosphate isomerase [Lunasporangiospora selenospora]
MTTGWIAVGMGGSPSAMTNNDLAICWPLNSRAVISRRMAPRNTLPTAVAGPVPFVVQAPKSGFLTSANQFTCTFSRPLNLTGSPIATTATSINVIYAMGLVPVQGGDNPQAAALRKHAYTGMGSLPIQRKDGSSTDSVGNPSPMPENPGSPNPGTGSPEDVIANQELGARLIRAHGVMMALTFLLILPLGALLVRFFGHIQKVFRFHRPVQVTGFLLALAAFICAIVAVSKTPRSHFSASGHAILGLVIICAMVIQVALGVFIFMTFNPNRDPPSYVVPTWMHRLWGYSVLIVGLVQVHMGISLYGEWPTGREGVWIAYYVWIAVVGAIFIFGSFIKKWLNNRHTSVESDKHAEKNISEMATSYPYGGNHHGAKAGSMTTEPEGTSNGWAEQDGVGSPPQLLTNRLGSASRTAGDNRPEY